MGRWYALIHPNTTLSEEPSSHPQHQPFHSRPLETRTRKHSRTSFALSATSSQLCFLDYLFSISFFEAGVEARSVLAQWLCKLLVECLPTSPNQLLGWLLTGWQAEIYSNKDQRKRRTKNTAYLICIICICYNILWVSFSRNISFFFAVVVVLFFFFHSPPLLACVLPVVSTGVVAENTEILVSFSRCVLPSPFAFCFMEL